MADTFSETVNHFEDAKVLQPPGEPVPVFHVKRDTAETGGVVVVKDGYTVRHLTGPQEGYRDHYLQDVTSLAEWILAHVPAADRAAVEVFVAEGRAVAILDPRHHERPERLRAGMDRHPLWDRWTEILGADGSGKWISQADLFRHLRAVKSTVGDATIILQKIQKAGVIESVESDTELNDTGGKTLRGMVGRKNSRLELPEALDLTLPVYLDAHARYLPPETYALEAIVETEFVDGEIRFRLFAPELPSVARKAQLSVATYLQTSLGDEFHVVLGTPETDTRSRLVEPDEED